MKEAFYAMAGAALTVAAALACGLIVFRKLGVALRRGEHEALAFLTGSAILSVAILGLSALHLARKGVFAALAAGLLVLACRNTAGRSWMPAPRRLAWLFLAITAPYALLYLLVAWAPEVSPDGSTYHLGNVLRYWSHHGLVPIRDMYGALPQGLEMLYLMAFSIGRHSAAALVHLAFLLALPVALISYGARFGMPKAGFLAAALVFCSPVIGLDGTCAYNDVALAAAAFGVVYLLELWIAESNRCFVLLAGLLAGFCCGIKYTGFVALIYGGSQLAAQAWHARSWSWRTAALFIAPCVLVAAPWGLKNAIYMHNPVAPFFNRLFPNAYISPRFERDYRNDMAQYGRMASPRELAIGYTVTGSEVGGFFGPLFLLAPLGLAALRNARGRRLLLAAGLFALPALANGGARFLIPAAPCVALAIGMAVADTMAVVPALMVAHGLLSWPSVALLYCNAAPWHLTPPPVNTIFDAKAASEYEHERLGAAWDTARIVDRQLPPGGRIFCLSCPAQAYVLRDIAVFYESLESNAMFDALATPVEPVRQPLKRVELSFAPISATRLRVVFPPARAGQVWTVSEMRLFAGGRELPRSPGWKIAAWPDPWEAPFAFDNNPTSRWSAERYGVSGAFLEVSFTAAREIDTVALDGPGEMPEQLALWAETAPRPAVRVAAATSAIAMPPAAGMRRAAIRFLESYGFEYLIVSTANYHGRDYEIYAAYWGIRPIARAGDWTIYHLE